MRIASLNLNGLRSAASKGFYNWAQQADVDVFLLQETRLQAAQRSKGEFALDGYQQHFHDAEAKGYSGVAIYTRKQPDEVIHGLGWPEFDREGRWIEARFGKLSLVSLYLPSGSSGAARQQFKFETLDRLTQHFAALAADGRGYIMGGDWNIAHRAIDLKNWRSNQKNSGFLPEERAWMERLLGVDGWVDSFRALHPDLAAYTWWSNRANAYANNVGWRIDYQIISPGLKHALAAASIYRAEKFSDHAPYLVDYQLPD